MKTLFTALAIVMASQMDGQTATPRLPYPRHTTYTSGSVRPDNVTQQQLDDSTAAFYDRWKARYLKNDCGVDQYYVKWDEGGPTICVSEAQGYAMMITAIMAGYDPNAQSYFDGLYRYCKAHPSAINSVRGRRIISRSYVVWSR